MIKKYAWDFALWARGSSFGKEYNQLKRVHSPDTYLTKLLLHAYQNVPYYTEILEGIGIVKNDNVDLCKFGEIPILTKETIREHQKRLISKDYITRKWYYNSSGGSTGEPIRFIQDDLYSRWGNVAFYYYYKDILGINEPNVKKIILWGSPRDLFQGGMGWKAKIVNWLTNTVFLNSFRMTEEDINRYIEKINSYKPDLIRGYANSLYELCLFAERENREVHAPKTVVSSAEVLTQDMRTKIEQVFKTKVHDYYGSRETSNLAGECSNGLMHILTFYNYLEVVDNYNQPVREGEEGRVIVTNLHNYTMPFIRYEIGDMAVLGPKRCQCGNPLPTLKKIAGRISESFVLENGRIVIGYFFVHLMGVVCNKGFIKKFQVIQEDYKKIRILLVPELTMPEAEKVDIENKIRSVMGQDCQIIWEFVDEIPKAQSGKYLYTKSLLHR